MEQKRCTHLVLRLPPFLVFCGVLASLGGCASAKSGPYVNPKFDFSLVKRVAVLPLETLAQDQSAGEKVRRLLVTEVLASGVVDVVEIGQVNRVLGQQGVQSLATLGPEDFKRLGEALKVQALILGSVDTYDRVSTGGTTAPEVTISLRAIDVSSGGIVWSTTNTGGGMGLAGKLFGLTSDSLSEVARKTVHEAVGTLFR
jgi:hypothetical protein